MSYHNGINHTNGRIWPGASVPVAILFMCYEYNTVLNTTNQSINQSIKIAYIIRGSNEKEKEDGEEEKKMKFALVSFTTTTVSLTTASSLTGVLRFAGHPPADAASSPLAASSHGRSRRHPHRRPGRSFPADVLFHSGLSSFDYFSDFADLSDLSDMSDLSDLSDLSGFFDFFPIFFRARCQSRRTFHLNRNGTRSASSIELSDAKLYANELVLPCRFAVLPFLFGVAH